jgi:hypothetical protein
MFTMLWCIYCTDFEVIIVLVLRKTMDLKRAEELIAAIRSKYPDACNYMDLMRKTGAVMYRFPSGMDFPGKSQAHLMTLYDMACRVKEKEDAKTSTEKGEEDARKSPKDYIRTKCPVEFQKMEDMFQDKGWSQEQMKLDYHVIAAQIKEKEKEYVHNVVVYLLY